MNTSSYVVSLKLVFVCLCLFGLQTLFAQFAGGTGTQDDPYMVATADHLNNVRDHLGSYFEQIRDIDLDVAPYNTGSGWNPIGYYTGDGSANNLPFTGVYDGNGFAISNLHINRAGYSFNGLFRNTLNATLSNMDLTNCSVFGAYYDGGLVAVADSTIISNCHVTGTISVQNTDGLLAGRIRNSGVTDCTSRGSLTSVCWDSGGLIGRAENSSLLRCYAGVTVSGSGWTGGLLGFGTSSTVSYCWSNSNVTGTTEEAGGLIGELYNSFCYDSFSTGNVNGYSIVGGFCGRAYNTTLTNCYSTGHVNLGGGFVQTLQSPGGELARSVITNCYWDTQTSGTTTSAGGTGLTTAELAFPYSVASYVGWDFTSAWVADSTSMVNNGYPYLKELPNYTPNPTFNPLPGFYETPQTITIQSYLPDAEIYYTLDGSIPTRQSNLYTGPFVIYGLTWIRAKAFIDGWFDSDVVVGQYAFPDGIEDNNLTPDIAELYPAYPNPFIANTTLSFSLPKAAHATLTIYNLKGQIVKTLSNELVNKGLQNYTWNGKSDDGKPVPNGMYIYKLKGNGVELTRKLTLMK